MRVIAGKLRGKPLISPIDNDVRPTIDRVKEGLFNVIQFNVEGSIVLDLFGGSGAIGIEAYSRGAKEVYICDNSSKSMKVIKENISKCKADEIKLILSDYQDALRRFKGKTKFNIVFLDPPYETNYGEISLQLLKEHDLLEKNAIIVFEHNEKVKTPNIEGYSIYKEKEYGKVIVTFYINND